MDMDFERIYETYYMQVYSYVMTLAKDSELSQEITQNAFFKAMSGKSAFRGQSSELTYLCAIAKNLYYDEIKRRKRFAPLSDDSGSEGNLESGAIDADLSYRIHVILHNMEEPYKEVFELRVFGELSFKKIASIFGKTESWARVTYHRARLKIQERMDEK